MSSCKKHKTDSEAFSIIKNNIGKLTKDEINCVSILVNRILVNRIFNNDTLRDAVKLYIREQYTAEKIYGKIEDWDAPEERRLLI